MLRGPAAVFLSPLASRGAILVETGVDRGDEENWADPQRVGLTSDSLSQIDCEQRGLPLASPDVRVQVSPETPLKRANRIRRRAVDLRGAPGFAGSITRLRQRLQ